MDFQHVLVEAVMQGHGDAVVATDRDGLIRFWNPGAVRIFGFEEREALGQSLDIIVPENLRGRHWEGFHHSVATGTSRYGAGDLLSVPALTKDGRRISVEFTVAMLFGEGGEAIGVAAVMRDVTQRFNDTKALRAKLAELQRAQSPA